MKNKYYIYIATNFTNSVLYTGITNNLIRRMYEHKNHLVDGFTKRYHVSKLVYFEEYSDIKDALEREKQIKAGSRKKIALINKLNPEWKDLYDNIV